MSCQPACQWGQIVGNQTTTATRAWRCTAMPQRPWLCNNVRTIAAAKERFLLKIEREKHPTVVHKRLSIVTHTHMNARTSEHTPLGGNTFWLPWVSAFYLNHSSLSQQVGLSFKAPTMIPGAWNVASDCARRCSLHTQTHTHRHARNGAQMAHPL